MKWLGIQKEDFDEIIKESKMSKVEFSKRELVEWFKEAIKESDKDNCVELNYEQYIDFLNCVTKW